MREDTAATRAAQRIRERLAVEPTVALVLGSGLGDLAGSVEEALVVATNEIDGYPVSTVPGHQGRLVFGRLEDIDLVIVQGRVHLYEGYSATRVAYPARLVHALGARRLVLTNAAGGINPTFRPGTLMFITNHINFAGARLEPGGRTPRRALADSRGGARGNARGEPLGASSPLAVRVRSTATPYDLAWTRRAEEAALRHGLATSRGTYLWTRGPSYETKAEIAAFRRLGADAVGMSTVPEALQAAALDMDVLGISTITNPAAGLGAVALSHDDVLSVGRRVRADLEGIVRCALRSLA